MSRTVRRMAMMAQMARDIKQKSEKKNSQVENKKISMNTELSELN